MRGDINPSNGGRTSVDDPGLPTTYELSLPKRGPLEEKGSLVEQLFNIIEPPNHIA